MIIKVKSRSQKRSNKSTILCIAYNKIINFVGEIDRLEFTNLMNLHKQKLEAQLFTLEYDNNKYTAVIKEIQRHPINLNILHIDFYIIQSDYIQIKVPVFAINRNNSLAIKDGAIVNLPFKKIEIIKHKDDTTTEINIDVTNLRKKQIIRFNDLKLNIKSVKQNPVLLSLR